MASFGGSTDIQECVSCDACTRVTTSFGDNVIKHENSYHEVNLTSKQLLQDNEPIQGVLKSDVETQFGFRMSGGSGNVAWQHAQVARGSVGMLNKNRSEVKS